MNICRQICPPSLLKTREASQVSLQFDLQECCRILCSVFAFSPFLGFYRRLWRFLWTNRVSVFHLLLELTLKPLGSWFPVPYKVAKNFSFHLSVPVVLLLKHLRGSAPAFVTYPFCTSRELCQDECCLMILPCSSHFVCTLLLLTDWRKSCLLSYHLYWLSLCLCVETSFNAQWTIKNKVRVHHKNNNSNNNVQSLLQISRSLSLHDSIWYCWLHEPF